MTVFLVSLIVSHWWLGQREPLTSKWIVTGRFGRYGCAEVPFTTCTMTTTTAPTTKPSRTLVWTTTRTGAWRTERPTRRQSSASGRGMRAATSTLPSPSSHARCFRRTVSHHQTLILLTHHCRSHQTRKCNVSKSPPHTH